jgi:hypothetical protein
LIYLQSNLTAYRILLRYCCTTIYTDILTKCYVHSTYSHNVYAVEPRLYDTQRTRRFRRVTEGVVNSICHLYLTMSKKSVTKFVRQIKSKCLEFSLSQLRRTQIIEQSYFTITFRRHHGTLYKFYRKLSRVVCFLLVPPASSNRRSIRDKHASSASLTCGVHR